MELVFVYGTLQKGQPLECFLCSDPNNVYVGEGRTAELHTLLDMGKFPALTRSPRYHVYGEVWRVRNIKQLDTVECVPTLYLRDKVDVVVETDYDDGGFSRRTKSCWAYFWADPVDETAHPDTVLPHGSWRRLQRAN